MMTIGHLRTKHRDVIITITIHEIVKAGIDTVLSRSLPDGNMVASEVLKCASDIESAYNENYNNFREIIKRGL